MSERAVKKEQNKAFPKVLKWFLAVLMVAGLEVGGIAAAVKITEMRRSDTNSNVKNNLDAISLQLRKIDALEKLPSLVSLNMQHVEATSNAVSLLSDSITQLEKEVGGNKIEKINQKIDNFSTRLNNLEETQSLEPIVLSVALMIKEDVLFGRPFAEPADVLFALGQDFPSIKEDIEVMLRYKNDIFEDNQTLATQYKSIIADFSFKTAETTPHEEENTMLSKSVKLLKDTMASMHFDKVAVLKKQKITDEEKRLLAELTDLVMSYKYDEVLDFVKANPQFSEANNETLNNWLATIQKKIEFDKALNHIIAEQLKNFRNNLVEFKDLSQQNSIVSPAQVDNLKEKDLSDEEVL